MERLFAERKEAILAECEVDESLFEGMLDRICSFMQPFADKLSTPEQRSHLQNYVAGLCSSVGRKTTETIAYFHQQDRQALQRFIGWGTWDHRPQLTELANQVGAILGEEDGILVVDSSAFAKKGTESVGVQRQWNGRAGKVDNCQMGVYLGYVSRLEQALVDVRLFLPRRWAESKLRRKKCHIPSETVFMTKLELTQAMIESNREMLPHSWVVGDDDFGRSTGFRREMRRIEERYLLAIPSNTRVRDLEGEAPPYRGFGKRPLLPFVRVDEWCSSVDAKAWTTVEVRDAEKGPLNVLVMSRRVLAITERLDSESEEVLVVTRRIEDDGKVVHDYWLSNASPQTQHAEFARVAKARGRIEQCLLRAKSDTGLADYETRSWQGWHHHQTLSLLASWFLVTERMRGEKKDSEHHLLSSASGYRSASLRCHRTSRSTTPSSRARNSPRSQRICEILSLEKT